ncbi:MAG TPA: tRNA adenosine(34) deaminase TadA [Ilumatobacteraceae bacterium]|nr:tRNA adenosine(34) deaminase TadA [Ilumatobacteraceae bacterium]
MGSNPTPSAMVPSGAFPPAALPSGLNVDEAMGLALDEAARALDHDDVPVGAIVVHNGIVIAARHNERELHDDPVAHAEILALRDAAAHLGQWRLDECAMYVTLEPCPMCAGALVNARLGHLVYAAHDPKAGAVTSQFNLVSGERLNHRVEVTSGVRSTESAELLRAFFRLRRTSKTEEAG